MARLLLRSLGPDWSQAHMEKAPQASGGGPARPLLHLPDQAPPDGRHHDGGPWGGGAGRPQGLPVGAGRGGVESRAAGRGRIPGAGCGGLGLVSLEEGPLPRVRPPPDKGEGLPRRLRRRDPGHRRHAPGHPAPTRQGAAGPGGRRLPALRQPGGGAHQGEQGTPRRARSLSAPRRRRALRQAKRPGGAGGRRPVAPAGSGRRDAPGGAVGSEGAHPLGAGSQGRRSRWETPPPETGGRSDFPKTCSGVTTSTWPAPAWASPP